LILAGRKPANGRFLIAMDGSAGAQRALDFALRLLGGSAAEFLLLNVQRNGSRWRSKSDAETKFAALPEAVSTNVQKMLFGAKAQLEAAGFDPHRIRSEILTGAISRAGAIVEMAEKADADTIVMGRKGISQVQDFIMGRVSNKVLHLGRQFNIWMAG
jgi:nucleotide-binding universal stress UspA family protein